MRKKKEWKQIRNRCFWIHEFQVPRDQQITNQGKQTPVFFGLELISEKDSWNKHLRCILVKPNVKSGSKREAPSCLMTWNKLCKVELGESYGLQCCRKQTIGILGKRCHRLFGWSRNDAWKTSNPIDVIQLYFKECLFGRCLPVNSFCSSWFTIPLHPMTTAVRTNTSSQLANMYTISSKCLTLGTIQQVLISFYFNCYYVDKIESPCFILLSVYQ